MPEGKRAAGAAPRLERFDFDPAEVDVPWLCLVRRKVFDMVGGPGNLVGVLGTSDLLFRLNDVANLGTLAGGTGLFVRGEHGGKGPGEALPDGPANRAMAVFDDFRRDLLGAPVLLHVSAPGGPGDGLTGQLRSGLAGHGGIEASGEDGRSTVTPRPWLPSLLVRVEMPEAGSGNSSWSPEVPLEIREEELVEGSNDPGVWDLWASLRVAPEQEEYGAAGTWLVTGVDETVRLLRLLAIFRHAASFESFAARGIASPATLSTSVILCTIDPLNPWRLHWRPSPPRTPTPRASRLLSSTITPRTRNCGSGSKRSSRAFSTEGR